MARLREHDVCLLAGRLGLRAMTEGDWEVLLAWNSDSEVLYYCEGANVTGRTLDDVQEIYRGVSQKAFVFMAELDGEPIGECWLQEMNLARILTRHPGLDLRRIDLTIGEKRLWGKGWGTVMIGLLTRFGFERCGADAIFGCDVADYNPRSRRAFEKNRYVVDQEVAQPAGMKAKVCYDMMLRNDLYEKMARDLKRYE